MERKLFSISHEFALQPGTLGRKKLGTSKHSFSFSLRCWKHLYRCNEYLDVKLSIPIRKLSNKLKLWQAEMISNKTEEFRDFFKFSWPVRRTLFFSFFFFRKIGQSRYWTQTMIPTRFSWLNKNLEPKQADMIENSDGTRTVLQYLMSIKAYNSMLSKRHRLCTEVFLSIAWAIRRNISNWISNRKLSRHQALKGYSL